MVDTLTDLSEAELLEEIRAREASAGPAAAARAQRNPALSGIDDATLVKAARAGQKVIYGVDNRIEAFQVPAGADRDDVESVVALFDVADVLDNGNGTSTLRTQNFGTSRNLCPSEPFRDQPIGAFCSGFLVGPDLVATAGHCASAANVTDIRFVFGFRMLDATNAETIINNGEVYRGASIVDRQEIGNGADWALVRLDRPVSNHRIAAIRRGGKVPNGQAVHVIGHPVGLPVKFAGGAAVRDNNPAAFFVANLDTYGGNSGSPVFNSDTHEVEGILVRGETDFVTQGTCRVSMVCPDTGCRGEDVTRATEFANLIPVLSGWRHNDLTVAGGAPGATGVPAGYMFDAQGTQHVVHRGGDGHVHELWWDSAGWHHNDLTAAAGAPICVGDPAGYMFDGQGTQHVVYRGEDRHIHELWWDGAGWHYNDLTVAAGAPGTSGDPAGYMFDSQGTQHVVYRGADSHIHELWWDSTGWHYNDLTVAAGAPPAGGNPDRLHVRRAGHAACRLPRRRQPYPRAVVGQRRLAPQRSHRRFRALRHRSASPQATCSMRRELSTSSIALPMIAFTSSGGTARVGITTI